MQSPQIVIIFIVSFLSTLSAQSKAPTAQPPSGLKRVPPAQPLPKNVSPLLQQYDFGDQLRTLENPVDLRTCQEISRTT